MVGNSIQATERYKKKNGRRMRSEFLLDIIRRFGDFGVGHF
jgi:hypothetical protein